MLRSRIAAALKSPLLGAVLFAAAYVWYRRVGLGWFTTLLGLVLLSTSFAFAGLIHGWELDKLIEPSLFLCAAIAEYGRTKREFFRRFLRLDNGIPGADTFAAIASSTSRNLSLPK